MEQPLFLGVDLGTSFVKLQVIDASGALIASASAPLALNVPRPNWAEQNPADWWVAFVTSCRDLLAEGRVAARQIAAIGLSGQMHGAVFLDQHGESLRPSLIWADARTEPQIAQIDQLIPRADLIAITGNAPNTSFTAAKILWVQQNEPDVYQHTAKILLPKDYLRWRLTGAYATDVSDASATLLFDLAKRNWSAILLDRFGVGADLLPSVYESTQITGAITHEAAAATGLIIGTPVVAGGGDAECGAFGMGLSGDNASKGAALTSIGTSGQIFMVTDQPLIDPLGRIHTLCHVIPNRWHVMGAILAGGVALRWLRDTLTPPGEPAPAYDAFTAAAVHVAPGADGLLFLPYLLGERTPYMDPQARGVFFGLRLDHSRAHLIRAVMEGVVFALRDGLEIFRELGAAPGEIRAVGGAAQSELWRQIQRDVLGLPLRGGADHGAAFGAALLAALGVGAFNSVAAAQKSVALSAASQPDPAAVTAYDRAYQRYHRLYPALKNEFDSASQNEE